jgi:stage V sporulation protein AE
MDYIKAFLIGGAICVIGQILLDKTKITNARILVLFVVSGCVLTGLGLYEKLVGFAGAGATVPLPGFGYSLTKGVMQDIDLNGFSGIFTGALKAVAAGLTAAMLFALTASFIFNPKEK